MGKKQLYPLAEVVTVKVRRVEEAERMVKVRLEELQKEEALLAAAKRARDEVLKHHSQKLAQLRHVLDTETTSTEVKQMKQYLEIVKEKLSAEEKKVADQQTQVDVATRNLAEAKEQLQRRRIEVDKLKTHRGEWERDARKAQRRAESKQESEMGSVMHIKKTREKRSK